MDASGEFGQPRDLDPVGTLQKSLQEQGLFVLIEQGARDDRGPTEVTYKAIVLGQGEVEEVIAKANSYEGEVITDPSQLRWAHVEDRPEVFEGEDRMGALNGAISAFYDS
ncbi:MAG TPA: hypothetical protein VN554_02315 [Verrucomicrobiae bacterium]|nr:hypothetical protein [Verrucomicrobiae bacterium]